MRNRHNVDVDEVLNVDEVVGAVEFEYTFWAKPDNATAVRQNLIDVSGRNIVVIDVSGRNIVVIDVSGRNRVVIDVSDRNKISWMYVAVKQNL